MSTVRVYRVESKCGEGIFRHYDYVNGMSLTTMYNETAQIHGFIDCGFACPLPEQDSTVLKDIMRSNNSYDYYFGFQDYAQLKVIFGCDEARLRLRDTGKVVIRIYEVESEYVAFGEKQMVFKMEHSAIVATADFYTFKETELKW